MIVGTIRESSLQEKYDIRKDDAALIHKQWCENYADTSFCGDTKVSFYYVIICLSTLLQRMLKGLKQSKQ